MPYSIPEAPRLITNIASMAYLMADLRPFMPQGFERLEVQERRRMARFIVKREQSVHEEWAILSIELLPLHEVIFANIREVSLEFLVQLKRV
jgi:hypothetical protein